MMRKCDALACALTEIVTASFPRLSTTLTPSLFDRRRLVARLTTMSALLAAMGEAVRETEALARHDDLLAPNQSLLIIL